MIETGKFAEDFSFFSFLRQLFVESFALCNGLMQRFFSEVEKTLNSAE